MGIIGDEKGDASISVSTIQIQAKLTSQLLLRTFTEESKAQITLDACGYRLIALRPSGQVDSQIV
jgi:hypothetical protein